MSDVNETLQQLVERRLREMGEERGRGEPLSLHEVWLAVPEPKPTYEAYRRVQNEGHSNIRGATVRTLATMLEVTEDEVYRAAKQKPLGEPFVLPERAAKLNEKDRRIVLNLVERLADLADEREHLRAIAGGAIRSRMDALAAEPGAKPGDSFEFSTGPEDDAPRFRVTLDSVASPADENQADYAKAAQSNTPRTRTNRARRAAEKNRIPGEDQGEGPDAGA